MEITLLDTPGHVDFSAEMERTLQVLDYAILVINGMDGVQSHTDTLWKLLKRYEIPTFIFVNKMDMEGTDKDAVFQNIRKKLLLCVVASFSLLVDGLHLFKRVYATVKSSVCGILYIFAGRLYYFLYAGQPDGWGRTVSFGAGAIR